MLDIDALNAAEGENWVYKGATVLDLGPGTVQDIVLLRLSRGGADATVIREFNLETKSFVTGPNGFNVPEAKTQVCFKTRDLVMIGTDTGDADALTDSGYPRLVQEWKRGEPLSAAKTVFTGEKADVTSGGSWYHDRGHEYELIHRAITFYTSEVWARIGGEGELAKLDIPDDAEVSTFADQLLVTLRSDWTVAGRTFSSGALLSVSAKQLLAGDTSNMIELFVPSERAFSHAPSELLRLIYLP